MILKLDLHVGVITHFYLGLGSRRKAYFLLGAILKDIPLRGCVKCGEQVTFVPNFFMSDISSFILADSIQLDILMS